MAASTATPDRRACSRAWATTRAALRTGLYIGGLGMGVTVLGCGTDTAVLPPIPAVNAYWALQLNQRAVMLALQPGYDTVQLTATPVTAAGTSLTTTGTVSFLATDTTISVSPTGLVTARHLVPRAQPVQVIATLRDPVQGVTHTDTAVVAVTAAPLPAFTTYTLQPLPGDSAKRALEVSNIRQGFNWRVRAVTANQDTVCWPGYGCGLLVSYRSSNPRLVTIDPLSGHVVGQDTGHVVLTAETYAYGQVLRDSVQFQIGYMTAYATFLILAAVGGVLALGLLGPKKIVLGVGATLMFCNVGQNPFQPALPKAGRPIDVVFDHPEGVDSASCAYQGTVYVGPTGSGNLAPFGGDTLNPQSPPNAACRRFTVPGVYHFHSALFPTDTYEIDIQQDPQ